MDLIRTWYLLFDDLPPDRRPTLFPPSCNPRVTNPLVMSSVDNLKISYVMTN